MRRRRRRADRPLDAIATGTCPIPTNVISSRHCEIRRDGDAWLLKDISTNGTFLNDAAERLAEEHRIAEGDLIRIGHYEIVAASAKPRRCSPPPRPRRRARHRRRRRRRPERAELQPAAAAARAARPRSREPVPDNVTVMWDSLADINKVDWARGGFGVEGRGAAPVTDARRRSTSWSQRCIEAARSTDAEVAAIARAGRQGRRAAASGWSPGLLVMVEARARAKAQMGAETTGLQLDGNNPIKFARSPEQALAQLLNPPEPGFMDADKAVEDAYLDLQSHQVATLKAIPGALRATLDRFSPGSIRRRARECRRARPGSSRRSATRRCGAITSANIVKVKNESDEAFMEVFAKEFRKAYERQLRDGFG